MTHIWEEREREEIIIAPHLFERKEIMADNPEKPGPIQTCRWGSQTEAKKEQERKMKRQMGGREGKNIHKNPVVYEEEETFQRFRTEIIEACKTSQSQQLPSSESGSFSLVTSPGQKCADLVP
ncbi:hypothetical protein CDAR_477521 [Caerostris darwini]|uniref:Uncharacterized protein n=1 Tax=Caerostris darwini TaxID=1538125 RepID=A0AAV4RS54_9ARAC|nr:hypothetical protein CDAR_477521 [Caerostris darwini]